MSCGILYAQNRCRRTRFAGECAEASAEKASPVHWFDTNDQDANAHEVLFFALLIVSCAASVASLNEWAKKVLLEKSAAETGGAAWKAPTEGWGKIGKLSKLFAPLDDAYLNTSWSDYDLDTIGAAMRFWDGAGRHDKITHVQLRTHLSLGRDKKLRAARRDKKTEGALRWRSWTIVRVAELVYGRSGVALRKALKMDGMEPADVPTYAPRLPAAPVTQVPGRKRSAATLWSARLQAAMARPRSYLVERVAHAHVCSRAPCCFCCSCLLTTSLTCCRSHELLQQTRTELAESEAREAKLNRQVCTARVCRPSRAAVSLSSTLSAN